MANPISRLLRGLLGVYRFIRSFILNLLFLLLLVLLLSPLLPQSKVPVPAQSALLLNPAGTLVEQRSYRSAVDQLLEGTGTSAGTGEVLLQDVLDAIDLAREDERINSLVIQTDGFAGGGLSQLRDVAAALDEFRSSGKPIYALGASFTQAQYHLASQADEILMSPLGMVEMEGFGSWQLYYRDALDKLGVTAHVFRVGEFKAAVEPYERNDMSPEARENYVQLLGEMWSLYLEDISARRDLDAATINDYINRLDQHLAEYDGDSARLAEGFGLVDRLSGHPQSLAYLQTNIGTDGDSYRHIDYRNYLVRTRPAEPPASIPDRLALIVASGEIHDGESTSGSIGSATLASLIREARNDERLKALVLRIDSPGGTVTGSEEIREELLAYKATGRPLVVSMGNVAASGGYWIATPADQIWASPATITGSIGIFGVLPTLENSLDKLGLSVDGVGTTALSGGTNIALPLSPLVARSLQLIVENGYARFLNIVAEARGVTADEVHSVGQGRIWSGQTAQSLGLVDELGSLEDALDAAAQLAGLDNYATNLLAPRLSPMQMFVQGMFHSGPVQLLLSRWQPEFSAMPLRAVLAEFPGKPWQLLLEERQRKAYVQCLECAWLQP